MPDILICGVSLPKYGCAGCYFKTGKYCGIIVENENVEEYSTRAERHPDCPLVELPPHGDLCDRSVILAQYDAEHEGEPGRARTIIMNAPVVVPAERSDTDA